MKSRAEAAPVDGVKFGHGPAMTVAKIGFLIVFVVEFDRGAADVAYLGRNFACDGLFLNLQGYFGSWKEGHEFHRSEWELGVWVGQFIELGGGRCITFGVQLDLRGWSGFPWASSWWLWMCSKEVGHFCCLMVSKICISTSMSEIRKWRGVT